MMNNHTIGDITYLDNRYLERKNPSLVIDGEGFKIGEISYNCLIMK